MRFHCDRGENFRHSYDIVRRSDALTWPDLSPFPFHHRKDIKDRYSPKALSVSTNEKIIISPRRSATDQRTISQECHTGSETTKKCNFVFRHVTTCYDMLRATSSKRGITSFFWWLSSSFLQANYSLEYWLQHAIYFTELWCKTSQETKNLF